MVDVPSSHAMPVCLIHGENMLYVSWDEYSRPANWMFFRTATHQPGATRCSALICDYLRYLVVPAGPYLAYLCSSAPDTRSSVVEIPGVVP